KLGADARFWITINEPLVWASGGFLKGKWPPFKKTPFTFLSVCRSLALAHCRAFDEMKKVAPEILVGIAKHNIHFSSNLLPWNVLREIFSNWFWNEWFLNKISRCQDFIGLNYYFHKKFGGKQSLPKSDMGWDIYPE